MKGLLFLCVANSARSQMAEGIARALLPQGVGVWSAGSEPTAVRAEAVAVLREVGIDISGQRAKRIDAVLFDRIDTVVTLCGGNACPVLPGTTRSLHWEIADPAVVEGTDAARVEAFRSARDELRSHIAELVAAGRFGERPSDPQAAPTCLSPLTRPERAPLRVPGTLLLNRKWGVRRSAVEEALYELTQQALDFAA